MSDWHTERARELRANMTEAERKLWHVLRQRQVSEFKFRRQVPIGNHIADFVCANAKLVLEVDGGQHGTPTDAERERWFSAQGYRVLRFSNNEVEANLDGVYRRIEAALAQAPELAAAVPVAEESPWAQARRQREEMGRSVGSRELVGDRSRNKGEIENGSKIRSHPHPNPSPLKGEGLKVPHVEEHFAGKRIDVANDEVAHSTARPQAERGNKNEVRLHGLNACLAAFAARPQDLRKIYLSESRLAALRDPLAWCVKHRLGYRVVEEADLAKLTSSAHHEGVCFEMLRKPQPSLAQLLGGMPAKQPACLLWLDGVGNPHNFGAVLRSAAHFGVAAVLLPPDSTLTLSGAACRVAEGGAEAVPVVTLDSIASAAQALRAAGFALAATLPREAESIYSVNLPSRTVFVLGAESEGMQQALVDVCTLRVNIPGTGKVESLNIANAVGVLLSEHWRRHAR